MRAFKVVLFLLGSLAVCSVAEYYRQYTHTNYWLSAAVFILIFGLAVRSWRKRAR